jgi:hypothetical protein
LFTISGSFEASTSPLKQLALDGWRDVRKDHDQAGVQRTLSHELAKIAGIVRDEYEFFAPKHLSELMIFEPPTILAESHDGLRGRLCLQHP